MRLHHVQVAMPAGEEAQARHFYGKLLGLTEVPKPAALAARGGVWFAEGLHLGVEADFHPARKAHPAFEVQDLAGLAQRLRDAGVRTFEDAPLEGYERLYVSDPFGNRVELLMPGVAR